MPARRNWDPYYRSPFLAREIRLARHRSILGPDAICGLCGETRLTSLHRRGRELICYECLAVEEGRNRIEFDHPLGRGDLWIHYTKPTPGNTHRLLSDPDRGPDERLRAALEPDERLKAMIRRK